MKTQKFNALKFAFVASCNSSGIPDVHYIYVCSIKHLHQLQDPCTRTCQYSWPTVSEELLH